MNCSDIILKPIGTIRTPFADVSGIPIQGRLAPEHNGRVELFPEFEAGCRELDGFSHIFLLYYFHLSESVKLVSRPYLEDEKKGVFAIRSPHRPNHIGLTLVELISVKKTTLEIKGVDMVDNTPLLDIKPYNPAFDTALRCKLGWMEKHFRYGDSPDNIMVTGKNTGSMRIRMNGHDRHL